MKWAAQWQRNAASCQNIRVSQLWQCQGQASWGDCAEVHQDRNSCLCSQEFSFHLLWLITHIEIFDAVISGTETPWSLRHIGRSTFIFFFFFNEQFIFLFKMLDWEWRSASIMSYLARSGKKLFVWNKSNFSGGFCELSPPRVGDFEGQSLCPCLAVLALERACHQLGDEQQTELLGVWAMERAGITCAVPEPGKSAVQGNKSGVLCVWNTFNDSLRSLSLPKFSEWSEFMSGCLYGSCIFSGGLILKMNCEARNASIFQVFWTDSDCKGPWQCLQWAASLPQLSALSVSSGKQGWSFRWIISFLFFFTYSAKNPQQLLIIIITIINN